MLINEVCKECSLTKKAIEYYEKQGLLHPEVGENGYRNYSDKDVALLKEIAVLRILGLSISDIKNVLASSNKPLALLKYKYLMALKEEKVIAQQKCMEQLIENYDIENGMKYMNSIFNHLFTVREKLVHSFPGSYGMYLSIHFGQFLNVRIDNAEKKEAYDKIVHFLDNLNMNKETMKFLEDILPLIEKEEIEKMDNSFLHAIKDIDNYIESNKKSLEEYIKFRTSEEYKTTPAYKMQQLLVEFQQSSGYDEIFLSNLKILSDSYRKYIEKLDEANELLIRKYPQLENLYKQ